MISFKRFLKENVEPIDLDKLYAKFNRELFDNKLPKNLPIKWKTLKSVSGYAEAKGIKFNRKKIITSVEYIAIDKSLKRSENEIISILLHEMIHVRLYIDDIVNKSYSPDNYNHGKKFEDLRKEIEAKSKIAIPVSETLTKFELNDTLAKKMKEVGIIFYKKNDNKWFGYLYNADYFRKMENEILQFHEKHSDYIKTKFKTYKIGYVKTNLHTFIKLKRSWKRSIGGGQTIYDNLIDDLLKEFRKVKEY